MQHARIAMKKRVIRRKTLASQNALNAARLARKPGSGRKRDVDISNATYMKFYSRLIRPFPSTEGQCGEKRGQHTAELAWSGTGWATVLLLCSFAPLPFPGKAGMEASSAKNLARCQASVQQGQPETALNLQKRLCPVARPFPCRPASARPCSNSTNA